MIVLKFGGTSVGGAAPIRRLGEIVAQSRPRDPVVVVSAVSGVTSRLLRIAELAKDRGDWAVEHERLVALHQGVLVELSLDPRMLDALLQELFDLLRGIELLRECTPRTLDFVASFGERFSARIVAAHLASIGIESRALEAGDVGLVTDERFGCARPLADAPARIVHALSERTGVPVITGYIARTAAGDMTTLGRGGSDYSAAIFGAALGAEEIQIWTDVDGVMTADPRLVPAARHIERLSYAEAAELAFFGAKVLHPATITPAVERGIPIRVLNSFRPQFAGTVVVGKLEPSQRRVKSIATKDHIVVVNIVAGAMMLQYGFVKRIADVFAQHEIVIDMIATSEVSLAMTADANGQRLEAAAKEIGEFAEVNVVRELSLISIVGEELKERTDFAAVVFGTLAELKVRVEMISYGATRNNLSLVVPRERRGDVVSALHQRLFG
jgi:aspartate kinase